MEKKPFASYRLINGDVVLLPKMTPIAGGAAHWRCKALRNVRPPRNGGVPALTLCKVLVVSLSILLASSRQAPAINLYWDINGSTAGAGGTAPSGNWDNATSNWNTASDGTGSLTTWTANSSAVFSAGTDATGAYTVTLAAPISVAGITREDGALTILGLSSNPISFPSGLSIDSGASTLIINAFYGTTSGVITKTAGTGIFSSGTSQTSFAGKWVNNQGSLSFAGDLRIGVVPSSVVSDQITLNNGAKLRSSTSGVTFNANRGITLGSGGGGFDQNTSVTLTWNGPITGTSGGTLSMSSASGAASTAVTILTNTGNNYDGATSITAGTLRLGASQVIPNGSAVTLSNVGSANLDLNNFAETIASLAGGGGSGGNVQLGSGTLSIAGSASTSYGGAISGGGSLAKNGAGTLTLAGSSSYSGGTTISQGTLSGNSIANSGASSAFGQGNFVITNNATLEYTGGTASTDRAFSLTGNGGGIAVDGTGPLTVSGLVSGTELDVVGTNTLTLTNSSNSYAGLSVITSGTLSGNSVANSGANSAFGQGSFSIANGATLQYTGSTASTDRTITLGSGGGHLDVASSSATLTVSGIVGGTGGLVKDGTGTLKFSGAAANTYSGTTTINNGTVLLGKSDSTNAIPAGAVTIGDGVNTAVLRLAANDQINNQCAVTVNTNGTFDLNGFTEDVGSIAGSGNIALGAGGLNVGANNASTAFSGTISGAAASGLVKVGSGTLTLSGANSFSGAITINAGSLTGNTIANSGSNSSFGAGSSFAISNGATLEYTGVTTADTNRSVQLNGTGGVIQGNNNAFFFIEGLVSGTGGLTVTGGPIYLWGTTNSYAGTNTIIGGSTLMGNSIGNIGTNSSFGRESFAVSQGGIDYEGASASTNRTVALSGWGGSISVGNATTTLTWTGEVSGTATNFFKTGPGTLQLNVSNSYTAPTRIMQGTLRLGASERIPDNSGVELNAFNPVFDLNNFTETIGSLIGGTGTVSLGSGNLITGADNTSTTFSGVITGSGTLTKAGTGVFTLTGANSYNTTVISSGTLSGNTLGDTGVNSAFGTGNITISNGATLQFTGAATSTNRSISIPSGSATIAVGNFNLTLSGGNLTGAGGLVVQTGGGKLILAGTQSYSGGINVNYGTLVVNGSISSSVTVNSIGTLAGNGTINGNVTSGGFVAPGNSPGIIHINGNYTQIAGSVLVTEVGGTTTAGVDYDQVQVSGNTALAGRFQFTVINNYQPQLNDEITFLTSGVPTDPTPSITGAPYMILTNLGAVNSNLAPLVIKNGHDLRLRFVTPSNIAFVDNTNQNGIDTHDWNEAQNWAVSPTDHHAPTTVDKVELTRSQTGSIDQVDVKVENAAAYQVYVHDQSSPITINVANDKILATSVGDVTIGKNATVKLGTAGNPADSGTLAAPGAKTVTVQDGGLLVGNGTITAGSLVVSNGTLRPGFSVGQLNVDGDYQQGSNGTLLVDINSTTQYDTVAITGSATLGGTLHIVASSALVPHMSFPIATADSFQGTFDTIESTGNPDVRFTVQTIGGITYANTLRSGDMNGDGSFNPEDIDLFVFALMNQKITKFWDKCDDCIQGRIPQQGGDFDDNGRVDFSDIAGFQDRLQQSGISSAVLSAAIDNYLNPVPEPSSAILAILGGIIATTVCGNRRRRERMTLPTLGPPTPIAEVELTT